MNLEALSMPQLVEYYNTNSGKPPIKKFRDKATAVRRCQELEPKPAKKKTRGWQDKPFTGLKHKIRPTMSRAPLIEALRQGATLNELIAVLEQHDKSRGKDSGNVKLRVDKRLDILAGYTGYGIKKVGDKYILVEK